MSETANANVYTEAQHFALLTSAIERETASLSESKETLTTQVGTLESEKAALAEQLADAKSRLDVVEAEKAAAEARAQAAAKEFADYKAELALQAEIADKRTARCEAVKAANTSLGSSFFTEERAQRWAEMSDEAFQALVADLTEAAAAKKETCATCDKESCSCDGLPMDEKKSDKQMARESAAFTGGSTATSATEQSTFALYLGARRRGSVA